MFIGINRRLNLKTMLEKLYNTAHNHEESGRAMAGTMTDARGITYRFMIKYIAHGKGPGLLEYCLRAIIFYNLRGL